MKEIKKFAKKLYEKIWTLFAIRYWMQTYSERYSKAFDVWCRKSLEEGHYFTEIRNYTAKFNGKTIWICNHPYASFCLYETNKPKVHPSRYTKHLMMKRLNDSWQE